MGLVSNGAEDGVKLRAVGASAVGVNGLFVGETPSLSSKHQAQGFFLRGTRRESRDADRECVGGCTGHNEHAAWSQTVAHSDIEDFYLVQTNAEGSAYLFEGKYFPLKFIEHKIWVKVGLCCMRVFLSAPFKNEMPN